jgi:hypothetical protein
MTDKAGHFNRPGAGPNTVNLVNPVSRMPLNLYYHANPITGKHEIVKPSPRGTADEVFAEFDTIEAAKEWFTYYSQGNV